MKINQMLDVVGMYREVSLKWFNDLWTDVSVLSPFFLNIILIFGNNADVFTLTQVNGCERYRSNENWPGFSTNLRWPDW